MQIVLDRETRSNAPISNRSVSQGVNWGRLLALMSNLAVWMLVMGFALVSLMRH